MMGDLTSLKQQLIDTILAADWAQADKDLAVRVAADLTQVLALQVAGKPVEKELRIVQASLANLSAAAQVAFGQMALSLAQAAIRGLFQTLWPNLVAKEGMSEVGESRAS